MARRRFFISALVLLIPFVVSACGIAQEQYDKVNSDLAVVKTQIQSLQVELAGAQEQIKSSQSGKEALEKKNAKALAYIEFLDVLLYPAWQQARITTRINFADDLEWIAELTNRDAKLGDINVSRYVDQLKMGDKTVITRLMDYCLRALEVNLK